MPTYRVTDAATLLGVSDDTVRRWVDAGRLAARRDDAGHLEVDGPALARLAQELGAEREPGSGHHSTRNRVRGIVTRVVRDTVMAQVELQAGPYRLVSLISREAADELGLEPGVVAVAVVKATDVAVAHVEARP